MKMHYFFIQIHLPEKSVYKWLWTVPWRLIESEVFFLYTRSKENIKLPPLSGIFNINIAEIYATATIEIIQLTDFTRNICSFLRHCIPLPWTTLVYDRLTLQLPSRFGFFFRDPPRPWTKPNVVWIFPVFILSRLVILGQYKRSEISSLPPSLSLSLCLCLWASNKIYL